MGEAELALNQAEGKPPEPGLVSSEEPVIWSHEVEVCLFHAMIGHKPVGVNRHFHMMCIRDKFSQNIGRQVSSDLIWEHLGTMYDMQALHESEILPFPNSEKSFSLPDDIIQDVKEGRSEEELKEELRVEPPTIAEEGSNSSVKSDRSKDRDKPTESNSKDDKKKRATPTPTPPAAKGAAPTPPAPKGGTPTSSAAKGGAPGSTSTKSGTTGTSAAKGGSSGPTPAKRRR
uniref:MRG/MORF4L binding protein n=1 Tax=Neogobius melanostomus TaxID=47308 RepID=A0A8C6T3D6_9GOBI